MDPLGDMEPVGGVKAVGALGSPLQLLATTAEQQRQSPQSSREQGMRRRKRRSNGDYGGALAAHPYAEQYTLVQCPTASQAQRAGEMPDRNFS